MKREICFLKGQYLAAKNKKESEYIEWLRENIEPLVVEGGTKAFDALEGKLIEKAEELDRKYPRTKYLAVSCIHGRHFVSFNIGESITLQGKYVKHIVSLDNDGAFKIEDV